MNKPQPQWTEVPQTDGKTDGRSMAKNPLDVMTVRDFVAFTAIAAAISRASVEPDRVVKFGFEVADLFVQTSDSGWARKANANNANNNAGTQRVSEE